MEVGQQQLLQLVKVQEVDIEHVQHVVINKQKR